MSRRGVKGEIDELLDDWVIAVARDVALALEVPVLDLNDVDEDCRVYCGVAKNR